MLLVVQFFKGFGGGGSFRSRGSGGGFAPMDEDFMGGMFGGGNPFGGGAHPFGGFSGEREGRASHCRWHVLVACIQ